MRKKYLMQKAFAVTLASAMLAGTVAPALPVEASTQNSIVVSNEREVLVAGRNYYVKNENATNFKSSDESVATVDENGKITPLKTGYVTISATINGEKVKTKFMCVSKFGVTASQKKVDVMLDAENVKNISIVTAKDENFEIKEGDYSKKTLTVKAPNADVDNHATFKKIKVKDVAENTFRNYKPNKFVITDKSFRFAEKATGSEIVVAEGASGRVIAQGKDTNIKTSGNVEVKPHGKDVSIAKVEVNGGTLDLNLKKLVEAIKEVLVNQKAEVKISGDEKANVKVTVGEDAKGSTLESNCPVDLEVKAEITINLTDGAGGSKINVADGINVEIKVDANVDGTVTVGDTEVKAGDKVEVTTDGKVEVNKDTTTGDSNTDNNNSSSNNGSYGGGYYGSSDTTAPVISPCTQGSILVMLNEDFANWQAPTLTATDNVDKNVTVTATYSSTDEGSNVTDLASAKKWLSYRNTGSTVTVTYNAKDSAGNQATPVTAVFTSRVGEPLLTEATDCIISDMKAGAGVTTNVWKEDDPESPILLNTVSIMLSGQVETGIPDSLKNVIDTSKFRTDNAYPCYTTLTLKDILPIGNNISIREVNTALDLYADKTGMVEVDWYNGKYYQYTTKAVTEENNDLTVLLVPDSNVELSIWNMDTGSSYHYVVNGKSGQFSIVEELTAYGRLQNELNYAKVSGETVICEEEVTIAEGQILRIPEGVTLAFSDKGKLNIELGGRVEIFGILNDAKEDCFVFSDTPASGNIPFPVAIPEGGTWINGSTTYVTHKTEDEIDDTWNFYDNGAGRDFWIVRGVLEVISDEEIVVDATKVHMDGGTIIAGNTTYITPNITLFNQKGVRGVQNSVGNETTISLVGWTTNEISAEHQAVIGTVTGSAISSGSIRCTTIALNDIIPEGNNIKVVEKNDALKYLESSNGATSKEYTAEEIKNPIVILLASDTNELVIEVIVDEVLYTYRIENKLTIQKAQQ